MIPHPRRSPRRGGARGGGLQSGLAASAVATAWTPPDPPPQHRCAGRPASSVVISSGAWSVLALGGGDHRIRPAARCQGQLLALRLPGRRHPPRGHSHRFSPGSSRSGDRWKGAPRGFHLLPWRPPARQEHLDHRRRGGGRWPLAAKARPPGASTVPLAAGRCRAAVIQPWGRSDRVRRRPAARPYSRRCWPATRARPSTGARLMRAAAPGGNV